MLVQLFEGNKFILAYVAKESGKEKRLPLVLWQNFRKMSGVKRVNGKRKQTSVYGEDKVATHQIYAR